MHLVPRRGFVTAALLLLAACGGDGAPSDAAVTPPLALPAADVALLFMGNSHTAVNDVPGMVASIVRAARPDKTVAATNAPGSLFLDERVGDPATRQVLLERRWSLVALQAQRSSSNWTVDYPITGAVSMVRMVRDAGAVPILFPEWPRRGMAESQLLFDLYVSIARQAPACVAPVPQAFDLAATRHPAIVLHAPDGNHSSAAGAYLAALVLASTITGASPVASPTLDTIGVGAEDQAKLRAVAADTVAAHSPREHCPGDP
jgi:hypothetical protein